MYWEDSYQVEMVAKGKGLGKSFENQVLYCLDVLQLNGFEKYKNISKRKLNLFIILLSRDICISYLKAFSSSILWTFLLWSVQGI